MSGVPASKGGTNWPVKERHSVWLDHRLMQWEQGLKATGNVRFRVSWALHLRAAGGGGWRQGGHHMEATWGEFVLKASTVTTSQGHFLFQVLCFMEEMCSKMW